jgi:O-antigen ligase
MGTEITEGDWNGRLGIWREGLQLFAEHPWLGVGGGAFRTAALEAGKLAHNFVISLLAEVGLIGFALFGAVLSMAAYDAVGQPKWLRRLWLAMFVAWLIGAISHNWEYRKQTWLFLGMVTAGATAAVRETQPRNRTLDQTQNEQ